MASVKPPIQRLLIVANGNCDRATLFRCHAETPDKIIAVDGGLRHCLEASLVPDVLLGDFDSATQPSLDKLDPSKTRLVDFPAEKDATDLELALQYANTEFAQRPATESPDSVTTSAAVPELEVMLAGLSGGRTDHMLANWMLLANSEWRFRISVFDALGVAYLVTPAISREVNLVPGTTFSLLPLTTTSGVTIEGAKYPLSDAVLYPYRSHGISNVTSTESNNGRLAVRINDGFLLLYVNIENDNTLE